MIRHMNRRLVVVIAFLGFLAFGLILLLQRPTAGGHKPIKRAEDPNRRGTLTADFQTKDFPEHGVRLIGPSSPEFAQLAQLIKSNEDSGTDVVPVFLKNTSKHSVVGYRITWECVDKAGIADVRDKSDIISYVFLHGDESDRIQAMVCDAGVMEPNSTWFISLDRPTQRVQDVGAGQTDGWIPGPELQRISKQCSKVTISLGQRWAWGCLGMSCSCSSTSQNNAMINSTVVMDSSIQDKGLYALPAWRICMSTSMRFLLN